MRFCVAGLLLTAGVPLLAQSRVQPRPEQAAYDAEASTSANVNSKYLVETIEFAPENTVKLSPALRSRVQNLVGANFDQAALEDLARRIREELRNRRVQFKVVRGSTQDQIKIVFEIEIHNQTEFDVEVPKLVYHSKQNFSFGLDASVRHGSHALYFGGLTDNDQFVERQSGVRGAYEYKTGPVALKAELASWRSQFNGATESAPGAGSIAGGFYRSRFHFEPSATFSISRPLTLQLGVSIERLEPTLPAAGSELASAANLTLRFQRRWEFGPDDRQGTDASYNLRSASSALASNLVYTRHHWQARYSFGHGRSDLILSAQGGLIIGRAPFYDRFVLGNSLALRGYNRFDLAPLGADRMAHTAVDYRYRWLRMIYESGSVWNRTDKTKIRHSAAIGITSGGVTAFQLLVAFPLRNGAIEPVIIAGLNF